MNVVLAYVMNVLLASQVVLVDPVVIVKVPSLALAVIVLLVAAGVFGWVIVIVGAVISIRLTVAVVVHVFHAVSMKLNIYDPLFVKVYLPVPIGFWKVIVSLGVHVTTTSRLVAVAGAYQKLQVGFVVSFPAIAFDKR